MTNVDIAQRRLYNQRIARSNFKTPGEVVEWLGAVQAQDYLGALWAVGLRMPQATQADIEQALADRTIVRTWPMRGTIHFVPPADVRWMLELMTPRIIAGRTPFLERLGLDEATFARSRDLFVRALRGGKQLTRNAMYQVLEAGHVSTANQRGLHIFWRLAQEGVICFAARAGKQPTFALLDEWVPDAKSLPRDQALAALAKRYFTSHGPATLYDFAWWTGLTVADAKASVEMVTPKLTQKVIDGKTYWMPPNRSSVIKSPTAFLLPAFDEYLVSYRDRSAALEEAHLKSTQSLHAWLDPAVVVDGQVVGTFKRTLQKDKVIVATHLFTSLTKTENRAVVAAANRYGEFLGLSAVMV